MSQTRIHPQLLADCHHLGRLGGSELLLQRNCAMPWFILVPDTPLADFLDMPEGHRSAVLEDCARVSTFIKQILGFDKVNFAGLGNVVPQMHLHVIGRRVGDACWPSPVWGNLPAGPDYQTAQLLEWQESLTAMAGLDPLRL